MKITLDIPNTVVAAVLTILRDESTHFTLGAYNIGPDEIRDGAIIILPRDEAKESPNSDLPRGCWRVENFDDVRAAPDLGGEIFKRYWRMIFARMRKGE